MPDNVPESEHEKMTAETIRGAFLDPGRAARVSRWLAMHRTRLRAVLADCAQDERVDAGALEAVRLALRRWL